MKINRHLEAASLYKIRVEGILDTGWADWLSGFKIKVEENDDGKHFTIFTGQISDQAALRGLLNRMWDMNFSLVSVNKLNQK